MSIGKFIYGARYIIILCAVLIMIDYISSVPTRLIVRSTLFIFTVYAVSLFSWFFIRRLLSLRSSFMTLWLLVPVVFLNLANSRFAGDVDLSYDALFWTFSFLVGLELIVWLLSLSPINRLFPNFLLRERNKDVKQRTLKCIARQIALEKRQPDDSHKACVAALYSLENLVQDFKAELEPYPQELLTAMRHLQQNHKSLFTDDYNSAKASMGSAINNAEKSYEEI